MITGTAGTNVGITNNPGASPAKGIKYYAFTILAPGCIDAGDGAVDLKTTYDTDGHFTDVDSVQLELLVAAWGTSNHAIAGTNPKFGVCIQTDIMIVNDSLESVLIERKNFDFVVTPILATFTVNAAITDSTVSIDGSVGEKSGTEVTGSWEGNDPLAPGDPIWFKLDIVSTDYTFVGLENVVMTVGEQPVDNLIVDNEVQDTAMTGSDMFNGDTEIQFYHILARSVFTGETQPLEMSGKALVAYTGRRRLEDSENENLTEKADFKVRATLMADDGNGSGGFKVEVLSTVIGGFGAIGVGLF